MKPWLEAVYEISLGGPSGSPILMTVHSSLRIAELRRLGLLAWNSFCFCAEEVGDDCVDCGVMGELE